MALTLLRFFGIRLTGKRDGRAARGARPSGPGIAALAGTFAVATGLAAACANGSSTGQSEVPEAGPGEGDDAPNPNGIGMPIISGDDSGTSTLPVGDGGEDSAAQGTTIITIGDDDDGGGDSGDGGGGNTCAAIGPNFLCGLAPPQCGCEPGQTCDVTNRDSGATSCVTAGEAMTIQGDLCTATSDCQVGLTCVLGACRPYCTNLKIGAQCTGDGLGSCAQLLSGGVAVPNEEICFVSCDLTNPAAACGANGCVNAGNETNCETVGTAKEFGACTNATSCAPGLGCITFGSGDAASSTCRDFCKFGGAACANNESCTHFSTDLVLNGATYGFCE